MRFSHFVLCLGLLGFSSVSTANSDRMVDFLLNAKNTPPGVVFELLEGRESDMQWAISMVQSYSRRLREKFPDLDIAVVSHGKEEFALMTSNQKEFSGVHKAVKQLVQDDNIPVHVCGTHASWYQKNEEDFPDYVDVVSQGPTQLQTYVEMGYDLIVIEKP